MGYFVVPILFQIYNGDQYCHNLVPSEVSKFFCIPKIAAIFQTYKKDFLRANDSILTQRIKKYSHEEYFLCSGDACDEAPVDKCHLQNHYIHLSPY